MFKNIVVASTLLIGSFVATAPAHAQVLGSCLDGSLVGACSSDNALGISVGGVYVGAGSGNSYGAVSVSNGSHFVGATAGANDPASGPSNFGANLGAPNASGGFTGVQIGLH